MIDITQHSLPERPVPKPYLNTLCLVSLCRRMEQRAAAALPVEGARVASQQQPALQRLRMACGMGEHTSRRLPEGKEMAYGWWNRWDLHLQPMQGEPQVATCLVPPRITVLGLGRWPPGLP